MPALLVLAAALPGYIQDVETRWSDISLDVDVTVSAEHCGYVNAWYRPRSHSITLCDELFDNPALTRWVFNHEMAHAYFHQHSVPVTDEELEADELAFWMSDSDESMAAVNWYLDLGGARSPDGQHPADLDRAAALLCLMDGVEDNPASRQCSMYARSSLSHWLTIFDLDR